MKGFRTVLANVAFAIPPLAQLVASPEVSQILPVGWLPWYGVGVAAANIYLRTITSTPVGKKY